jgi:hypothetical protein
MRKKELNSSGIELDAPRLIGQKPFSAAGFALSTILVALGVFGAAWCFISSFALTVLPFTVALYSVLFVLILSAANHLNRIRRYVLFALILLYAGAGYYLHAELVQGFLITTNQIMRVYANHSDFVLPIYDIVAKPVNFPLLGTVFVLFAAVFLTFFLCWAIIRRQSFILAFLVTIPFPLAALIFNIMPNFYSVLMLITCWAMLLFIRLSGGRKLEFVKIRGAFRATIPQTAAKSGLRLLPVVILCFALILTLFPQQSYQYPAEAQTMRNKITDAVNDFSLIDSGDALADSSNHVNLNNANSVRFTGRTMLQLQATEERPMYLKGFTGSTFTGTSWERLPDSEYQEINPKLNGMNVQNMFSSYVDLVKQDQNVNMPSFGVHVKNVSNNKKAIYAPYNLSTTPKAITGVKFINDEFIHSSSLFGTSEYTLYSYSMPNEQSVANPAGVFTSLIGNNIHLPGSMSQQEFSKQMQSYLTEKYRIDNLNSSNLKDFYTSTVPDILMNTLASDKKSFAQSEQDYRLFLYDKYTQLPQDLKEKIQGLLKEKGLMTTSTTQGSYSLSSIKPYYDTVNDMVNAVKRDLKATCSYSLTPGKVPDGKDFTYYFLTENRKGYCVHFATAATVMLRAMGVPARYAEGYIVTDDDYKNAVDGWANIKDSHAHAWVEIYYPGLGWQPVDVTPGFNVDQNQTQDNLQQSESSVSSTPTESKAESSASSTVESKIESSVQSAASTPKTQSPAKRSDDVKAAMLPVLFTIAVFALILAAAALRRRIVLLHRKKKFAQQDANKAVIAMYDYMLKLTRYGGDISEKVTDIALKARFSQHTVSREERKTVRDSADLLAQRNLLNASTIKKIQMKFIYNLI